MPTRRGRSPERDRFRAAPFVRTGGGHAKSAPMAELPTQSSRSVAATRPLRSGRAASPDDARVAPRSSTRAASPRSAVTTATSPARGRRPSDLRDDRVVALAAGVDDLDGARSPPSATPPRARPSSTRTTCARETGGARRAGRAAERRRRLGPSTTRRVGIRRRSRRRPPAPARSGRSDRGRWARGSVGSPSAQLTIRTAERTTVDHPASAGARPAGCPQPGGRPERHPQIPAGGVRNAGDVRSVKTCDCDESS